MPRLRRDQFPRLRWHKAAGQFVVGLSGFDHYLGADESEARAAYGELVRRWDAGGRKPIADRKPAGIVMADLCDRYEAHCVAYYVKRREPGPAAPRVPTSQVKVVRPILRSIRETFGSLPASDFGRAELDLLRKAWAAAGITRRSINGRAEIVRRMFRWAAENELVGDEPYARLKILTGLRKGRSEAADRPPVGPAPLDAVRAVQGGTVRRVADMIEVQLLTGMRPGEVCGMRACDVDRSASPWRYVVPDHVNKTSHRGVARVVWIGPKAQAVLGPYLDRCPPRREVFVTLRGTRYPVDTYRMNVANACRRLGVTRWHPHQLRHNSLSSIRERYGIEASQMVAGHSDPGVTLIYAAKNDALAAKVAEEMG